MKTHILHSILIWLCFFLSVSPAIGQKKKTVANDSNTPLHLLQPDYKNPYGVVSKEVIKKDLDRILTYLEAETPYKIINKDTGKEYPDISKLDQNAQLLRGSFRLTSYEWGVTYAAMLAAANATGDKRYADYVFNRFYFLYKAVDK